MTIMLNLLSFVDRVVGGGDAPRHVVVDRSEIYRCFQLNIHNRCNQKQFGKLFALRSLKMVVW